MLYFLANVWYCQTFTFFAYLILMKRDLILFNILIISEVESLFLGLMILCVFCEVVFMLIFQLVVFVSFDI